MAIPWTLLRYILLEMGKTFGLTAAALTALLTCGGGVMQMVKLGDVSPDQLVSLLALIVPVSLALTLPIAALFSATATYGRLSADNEFVACRSSGINLLVLFLPTVALSIVSASITFAFINFVIPGMVRNINEFIDGDVGKMVERRLDRPGGIRLGRRFRISADECVVNPNEPNRVLMHHVAFVQADDNEWTRYGTAQQVVLNFDRVPSRIKVSGWMSNLSYYDRKQGQFVEQAEQVIPTNVVPSLLPQELKFLNLGELLYYHSMPQQWDDVRDKMERLRVYVGQERTYAWLWEDWRADSTLELDEGRTRLTLSSKQAIPPDKDGIQFLDVAVEMTRDGERSRFTAKRAILDCVAGASMRNAVLRLQAFEVVQQDGNRTYDRPKQSFPDIAIPQDRVDAVQALSNEELLAVPQQAESSDWLTEKRQRARGVMDETLREIRSTISERMAFSVSVFVLMILGAALGIIFRGAHVVTAFGISFVPSLIVIIAIVMGKQLAHNSGTHMLGIGVMWSGIAGVALLDLWTTLRVLRR